MPRPVKCRRVDSLPSAIYFKPAGVPMRELEEVCLLVEELEAVRLKDLEGLEQEQGAQKMNISRPTFQRILTSAHKKIADALFHGKAVRIAGGNFEVPPCRFKCAGGHEWDLPFSDTLDELPQACPVGAIADISCSHPLGKECGKSGHAGCCRQGRF
jgi:predicted DNA-binding protein (UPF0251 family)